ncbi:hypothetical protein [Achromobacter aloeverae]
MALVNFFESFGYKWAQTGLTDDTLTDAQYKLGYAFLGSLPPTVEQFNKIQQVNDEKLNWFFQQFSSLAALTGRQLAPDGTDALTYALQNLDAAYLKTGLLPVTRGGTGLGTVLAGSYLKGAGTGALVARTPAQVLVDIGGAPLNSPELTGTPTAPTADPGTNTTQLATCAFVAAALAALVASAPAALDTLNELAAALGNDPNFATTVLNGLAAKANTSDLANYVRLYSITALPTTNVGPFIGVGESGEIWSWVETAYYQGYRHALCGMPMLGHTQSPLVFQLDVVGGLCSKTAYNRVWAYAQENGLVVSQSVWDANPGAHYFVDVNSTQFRSPNLQNQFTRFTGTDADTANARALGSWQIGAQKDHKHITPTNDTSATLSMQSARGSTWPYGSASIGTAGTMNVDATYSPSGEDGWLLSGPSAMLSGEVRPGNVAFYPRIHA